MKRKHLREDEFDSLKALLDAGVTATQVAKVSGRSRNLLYEVRKHDSFADYKQMRKEYSQKVKEKANSVKEKEPAKADSFNETNSIVAVLKAVEHQQQKTNELLQKIIDKQIDRSLMGRLRG